MENWPILALEATATVKERTQISPHAERALPLQNKPPTESRARSGNG